MSKKIYVGNLSFRTTEEELTSLFEQVGSVESVSITAEGSDDLIAHATATYSIPSAVRR